MGQQLKQGRRRWALGSRLWAGRGCWARSGDEPRAALRNAVSSALASPCKTTTRAFTVRFFIIYNYNNYNYLKL